MAAHRYQLNLLVPDNVYDALRAEALRRLTSPGKVAVDVLTKSLPAYLAEEVRRSLAPPIEVEAKVIEKKAAAGAAA